MPSFEDPTTLGRIAAQQAAIVFLLKREFGREASPRQAAEQWFQMALTTTSQTDHAHADDPEHLRKSVAATMEAAYRELLEMRGLVLDRMA